MSENRATRFLRRVYGLAAFGLGLLYLPLAGLWISCEPSPFGWLILIAAGMGWVGLILGARGKSGPIFSFTSLIIIAGVLGIHHLAANSAEDVYIRKLSSPTPLSTPQPLPERDVAILGARVLNMFGHFSRRGQEGPNVSALSRTYKGVQSGHFAIPSPMPTSPQVAQEDFEILVFEPRNFGRKAIVFLHGYGGNWAMPCGMVAREANPQGFRVYCPTLDFKADWTSSEGRRSVKMIVRMLRDEGIETVLLGGISNGAEGASSLTRQFKGQIDGVILIAGVAPKTTSAGKPFIVFHGKADEMAPITVARSYAYTHPEKGELHALEGGHFAVLDHREAVWTELAKFLGQF